MSHQNLVEDLDELARMKDSILQQAPSKQLKQFLAYLQQNTQEKTCLSKMAHCFSYKRYKNMSSQFREAFQEMSHDERVEYYANVLRTSSSIISKKLSLPSSVAHLGPPHPKQQIQALLKATSSAPWRKQLFELDFENRKLISKNYSLRLRDYLLKKSKDGYLILVTLTPTAPALPHLQIRCQDELCQRIQTANSNAIQDKLVVMIQGEEVASHDTGKEECEHSQRPSISEQLSAKLKSAKEDICNRKEQLVEHLTKRHILEPSPKGNCKLLLPKGDIHYFFEGEFRVGSNGELIVCNQSKLEEQSNVIKYIIKRLLTGTKVFSISLPVQVFGVDSNLSLLLTSFRYAPLILQDAASLEPLNRFTQVIKFSLTCPACYIRCDKPFNPILGQTYQSIVDGTLFYGQQISHHPPISAAFVKGKDFTVYGSFQAEVEFGFNSAVGNNKGWVKISFDQQDTSKNVVKFTNSPGEMGGLIFGKRTLNLIQSVYYIDEENYIFCELFYGKVKLQNKVKERRDSIEGRILQLKRTTDLSKPQQITQKDVQICYGLVRGQWLGSVYFNDELLLETRKEYPPCIQPYLGLLPSDFSFREDIILKMNGSAEECQAAKEQLEEIQRKDRKLRESYGK